MHASGNQKSDFFFFLILFYFKLYIIVLVLPNTKMNPPQVYMCSPSWTLLPSQKSDLFLWLYLFMSSVQFLSRVRLFVTPWTAKERKGPQGDPRPLCPSPTPRVHANSCPLSRWCYPAISSSVVPFSSCPQSLPASGSFPVSQLLAWGGQTIGVSAWASVLPVNTQDWSPLGWTGWISLQSRDSRESSPTPQFKSINSSAHDYWKNHNLD